MAPADTHVFQRMISDRLPRAVKGDGVYIFDSDGKRYLDGSGGAAVSCLGHSDADVIRAIRDQAEALAFAHTGFFTSPAVGGFFPDDFEDKALADVGEKLAAFCAENVPSEIEVKNIVRHGNVYKEILEIAGEIGCGLIVIGVRRPEMRDYLLGPNAARVVRHANCSVLVVRD